MREFFFTETYINYRDATQLQIIENKQFNITLILDDIELDDLLKKLMEYKRMSKE